MAKYRVLQKSFVNDSIAEEGDIVILDDVIQVADNMELIVEAKKSAKEGDIVILDDGIQVADNMELIVEAKKSAKEDRINSAPR